MKIFAISGYSKSGKTTTGEALIKELNARGLRVRAVKDIHAESFCIDTKGSNTYRLKQAGVDMVTARGLYETDFLIPRKMGMQDIADMLYKSAFGSGEGCDILLIEGAHDEDIPRILTAKSTAEIDERMDKNVFAISGVISSVIKEYKGFECINALTDIKRLADIAESKALSWGEKVSVKRFNSKRNTVALNCINGQMSVNKMFMERKSMVNELFVREVLEHKGINVPKLINVAGNSVTYEYIEGSLLIDILEEGDNDRLDSAFNLLVKWLGGFYKALADSLGAVWTHNDLQLRNFILVERSRKLYGLDFELCAPGDIEKDMAEMFIFISAYEPRFSDIRIDQALSFLDKAVKLGLDSERFFNHILNSWEKIRKRRGLSEDAGLPAALINGAKRRF
ncbi:MAG: molybdopterin-guanine dinucleotide biosynthesis protein B [Clostridiales bacterium]|jgi:molybdopterin-guanine dinucleotide biosynthesis protein B|nr:molybdopterin-guanine dinucleotide biosynthesis protein B [Clostridiales bacterium]